MKRSLIPDRYELAEILLVGAIAGGIGSGFATLLRLGFDRNNAFAFLGAIVGAAIAVALTLAHEGRSEKRRVERDRRSILLLLTVARNVFTAALDTLSDGASTSSQRWAASRETGFHAGSLRVHLTEALLVIGTLHFAARVAIRDFIEDLDPVAACAKAAEKRSADDGGDCEELKSPLRTLLNGMELVRINVENPLF